MAQKNRDRGKAGVEEELSIEQLKKRLDNLDARLDAIDSMVTAVAERIVMRPLKLEIACPNCGKVIEIGVVGDGKMLR
ncbi:hypothetical protein ES703_00948 [subsurface metagenome]